MDVFRFLNPTSPTKMEQGDIINDLRTKMWVERYREAGEFRFTGAASSGIRQALPIGSFISHVDTEEIMVVENHEISDKKGEESEIVVTGRGFETILDQRIVGANKYFPSFPISDYVLGAEFTWLQALSLVERHILSTYTIDAYDAIPYITPMSIVSGASVAEERSAQRGSLYEAVVSLLEVDKIGIKAIRPGPWSPLGAGSENVALILHVGDDRSGQVVFSYDSGEIESSDYLWSNKADKNSALVTGKFIEVRVDSLAMTGANRRTMFVDASDIDGEYTEVPTDPTILNSIYVKMEQRGMEALAAQSPVALTKTEVSQENESLRYRTDFNVGDLITVSGAYPEITTTRRVSEFVEIEDETGRKAYPTLTID